MTQELFVTWQPVLTDHQAYTYEALSGKAKKPLLAYVLTMEDSTRHAQGWRDTQVASIERRLIPPRGGLLFCLKKMREHRHDIHFFGSAFQNTKMLYLLILAVIFRVEFYLISEPYSPVAKGYFNDDRLRLQKLKVLVRPYLYKAYMTFLKRRMSGIFSISSKAVMQFSESGVEKNKLFPFGYFIPSTKLHTPTPSKSLEHARPLKLVFVGALIERKGLDLLIEAVTLSKGPVTLDAYGPGDPLGFAFDNKKTRYLGTIPFGNAQKIIAPYDALVLPSHYDGWGVVVNEALCAGVPVICSNQVGARVLVETFGAGAVFDSESPRSLESIISALCFDPERLLAIREATRRAADAIQPEVAASYMLAVLRANPEDKASVTAPWYLE